MWRSSPPKQKNWLYRLGLNATSTGPGMSDPDLQRLLGQRPALFLLCLSASALRAAAVQLRRGVTSPHCIRSHEALRPTAELDILAGNFCKQILFLSASLLPRHCRVFRNRTERTGNTTSNVLKAPRKKYYKAAKVRQNSSRNDTSLQNLHKPAYGLNASQNGRDSCDGQMWSNEQDGAHDKHR